MARAALDLTGRGTQVLPAAVVTILTHILEPGSNASRPDPRSGPRPLHSWWHFLPDGQCIFAARIHSPPQPQ